MLNVGFQEIDLKIEAEKSFVREMIDSDLFKSTGVFVLELIEIFKKVLDNNDKESIKMFITDLLNTFLLHGKLKWSADLYNQFLSYYSYYIELLSQIYNSKENKDSAKSHLNYESLMERMHELIDEIFNLIDRFCKKNNKLIDFDDDGCQKSNPVEVDKEIMQMFIDVIYQAIEIKQGMTCIFIIYVLNIMEVMSYDKFIAEFPELDPAKQKTPEDATGGETSDGSQREPNGNKVHQRKIYE